MCPCFPKRIESKLFKTFCPVCFEDILAVDRVLAYSCGHVICKHCVLNYRPHFKYFQAKCPVCRSIGYLSKLKINTLSCTNCFDLLTNRISKCFLSCGHIYCLSCANKLKVNKSYTLFKCTLCKENQIIHPLYI